MLTEPTCKDCGSRARRLATGQWTCINPRCKNAINYGWISPGDAYRRLELDRDDA